MKHTASTIQHVIKSQFTNLVEEYIRECEHQDGVGFWDNFTDADEIAEDFRLYVNGKRELALSAA